MPIVSWPFAAFVVVACLIYHLLPQRMRVGWLLLASFVFCWTWSGRHVVILAILTGANFAIGQRVTAGWPSRRTWLWGGIAMNVVALFALRGMLGAAAISGLAFYSLQAISYLVDMHSGALKIRCGLPEVALHLTYFPKLISGPIERGRAFLPQLTAGRVIDDQTLGRAAVLIVVGITRKLVIADPLAALLPPDAFAVPSTAGAVGLAGALGGYAFVLYNDFAGYTSIVRGVSSLFGIELSLNFAQPFFAASFTEFWTRWHITLSLWLRDYVYLPLSRVLLRRNPALRNVPNVIVPPMASMLVSGLWHGASSGMVLWGALHGSYLVVERIVDVWGPATLRSHTRPAWRKVAGIIMVFVLATWTLAPFRMDASGALTVWDRLLSGTQGPLPDARIWLFVALSLWLDWIPYRHRDETAWLNWPRPVRVALVATAMLLWFLVTRQGSSSPFVYQGI